MSSTAPEAAASDIAVIRKYANRRLYDTARARCVTLADIAERVRKGQKVQVINARDGGDVTRQVLAQILCNTEADDSGMLDEDILTRLIRLSHAPEGQRVSGTLSRALDRLSKRSPSERNDPANRAAAMLRPKGNVEARAVAARIDALEVRLRALIARADTTSKRQNKNK
ncbi:MAG: polyhydroxyalkanoate synthesis repressor PhaR [Alphaproteobacteria bacterium]|jgi:polyhydroxyalkanoate synthesis repressor PhaR